MERNIFKCSRPLLFVLLTFFLLDSVPVDAGWTDLGLYGGQVYSIAMDRNNTSKLFAGTYYGGGLFRTDDSGVNWTPVLTGKEGTGWDGEATFSNTAVWGVQIAPSDSNTVWAVHNYWAERSTDGGVTWTHILNSAMQGSQFRFCKSVAIHPANPSIVYVGAAGYQTDSTSYGALYKTMDGGNTWTSIGPYTWDSNGSKFEHPVVGIDIDPQNGNNIYVLSASTTPGVVTSDVYRSNDGGTTWDWLGPFSDSFTAIKVKPDDPNTFFAAGWYGIHKFSCSTPSVCSDSVIYYDAAGSDIRALAFKPGNSGTLWVAGRGSYLGLYDIAGNSFTSWMDTGYQLLSLAIKPTQSPSIGEDLYGGELHKGIIKIRSRFRVGVGEVWSWGESNNGMNAIQVWDVAVDPNANNHYLAATEAGLYERASGGSAWTKRGSFSYTAAYAVSFDPASSTTYYVGTEGRVYRSTDGGATWPSSVAVSGYVTDIAVAPSGSSYLYVTTRHTGYANGSVYRIAKDLSSAAAIKPAGNFDYNAVVVDPNDAGYDRIFVGGGNYLGTSVLGKVYETTNANAAAPTWTERLGNVIVNALLIDPNDSNKLYAGTGWSGGTEIPLYKSTDSGATWQKAYEGIPGGPIRYGVWGTSASNLYVLRHTGSIPKGGTDDSYMIRYNGSTWAKVEIGTSKPLYGIWGSDTNNIFAVGESGTVVRYNGTAWSSSLEGSIDLRDVWGSSAANVYAVGKAGTILRFNGSGWFASTGPTGEDLHGIWGSSASNIFAVGSSGVILRYNGNSWLQMTRPVTETLEDIWGSSASSIFAVGGARKDGLTRYYTILRWNGSTWSVMTTPSVPSGKSGRLRSVWGSSGTDVFAAGDDGVILHYNGTAWSAMTSGTTDTLHGVWGISSTNVYAVGVFGTIMKYNGASWAALDPSADIYGEKAGLWNTVTDLAFSSTGQIYAATERQGIYASANGAKSWINLSAPPYSLYAVAAGSVISGGSGGGYSLSGEGLLYGSVTNMSLGTALYDARVNTDIPGSWSTKTDTDGLWAMFHPGGIFNVTASKAGFTPQTEFNVPVYGGTWAAVTFGLSPAATGPTVMIGTPTTPLTRSGSVTYTVTYTEADAIVLTNAHITLNATGATGIVEVNGTGNVRTVTISGVTGNGTLGISIAAGSAYDHSGAPFPAAGPSATFAVDNSAPGIISAASTTPNGYYKAGSLINVTVNFSEAVSSTGLTITLNSGASISTGALSNQTSYSGTYTVAGAQASSDLGITSITGTITDAAGNVASSLSVPAGQNIGDSKAIVVDTTGPSITSAISTTPNGSYKAGSLINVTVNFSEAVSSTGLTITLNSGASISTGALSNQTSYSGTYTVAGDQISPDLSITSIAGTITDTAGNVASSLSVPTGQNIGDSKAIVVDTTGPSITSATSTTPNGSYKAGSLINVTVNFSEAVSSTGLTITLNSGALISTGALSNQTSYSGTYTVAGGQTSSDLSITSITGTITDVADNVSSSLSVPAGQNIGDSKAIVVDTTGPSITSATSTTPNGYYRAGSPINVTVNFSEAISSTGLTITLNSGWVINTGALSDQMSYIGTYTVAGGQTSSDLSITSITGTITDVADNVSSSLSVPAGQNIGDSMAIVVDTTGPVINIVDLSTNLANLGPVTFTVTYTGADSVTLANGHVTLNRTGTANGTTAVTGTGMGSRTVTISGVSGNGTLGISIAAGTASDLAGNSAPAAGPSAALTVDNTPPNVPSVSGPSSTSNRRPSWTWTPGGGNGIYRYKLDSSDLTVGFTESTATSYTPGTDLTLGLHTLYVQERDEVGNWSEQGNFAIRIVTKGDVDGNGTIELLDAVLVLKMIAKLPLGADIYGGADVDGDGRIGTAEILYILQRIAEIRE